VIERDWYTILSYNLDDNGCCKHCGSALPGRFAAFEKPFGPQRIPVRLHAA
jgi:pyruvate formate lyase activating enzyme